MNSRSAPAASFIAEEPEYSQLAARLLSGYIDKEVQGQEHLLLLAVHPHGFRCGADQRPRAGFVEAHARKLNDAIDAARTQRLEYFGLRTLYDRYLLQASDAPPGHGDAAVLLAAHRGGAVGQRAGGAGAVRRTCPRWTTRRARPRCSTPARGTSSSSSRFLLDSPQDLAGIHLRQVQGRGAAVEILRRHRPRLPSRALARAR